MNREYVPVWWGLQFYFISTSFFAKYLRVVEDGPGREHLCHTDIFLVFKIGVGVKFYFLFFIFPDYTEIGDGWLKLY